MNAIVEKFRTALVVEDNPAHCELARALLDKTGLGIIYTTHAGAEGITLCQSKSPDVVVLDVDMPEVDGMAVLRAMTTLEQSPAIILVTSVGAEVLRSVYRLALGHNLNVIGCLEKPLTYNALYRVLTNTAARSEQENGDLPGDDLDEDALREALRERWFVPYFEPRIRRRDARVVGAEMLARLQRPGESPIPPIRFIAPLERLGLIEQLTWQLLEHDMAAIRDQDTEIMSVISVNLSPLMLDNSQLTGQILERIEAYGISPSRFTLEVTETAAVDKADTRLESLTRLRMRGFGISMDDFGTGFSSLAQLSNVPITELKIDRQFCMDAPHDAKALALCESSIELARKLGLVTCAEGVENPEVFRLLYSLGADYFQGHAFQKPLPLDEFTAWAREWNSSSEPREHYLREAH